MKSMTKKLTILLVVALLLATMCALVACGPKKAGFGEEEKGEAGKFTVVVLLPDGTPAEGCSGKMCEVLADGNEGVCNQFTTDENGVVTLSKEDLNYPECTVCDVEFLNLPDGYKMPEKFNKFKIHIGKKITVQLEEA